METVGVVNRGGLRRDLRSIKQEIPAEPSFPTAKSRLRRGEEGRAGPTTFWLLQNLGFIDLIP
jgi:hypothetical protein